MSTSARSRFQRLALVALGALLVALGASRLSGAFARTFGDGGPSGAVAAPAVLYDETFRVTPGGRLDLDLGSEAVTVRTVAGTEARVTVEGRGRDAEREFERRRFSARASGGGLDVRTDPPRRMFSRGRSDARFEVTVEVPRRFDVALDVGSGAVAVGDLDGDLVVDTGSGAVVVGDVAGDRIRIDTGSGAVRAGRLRGDVRVDTGSGAVRLARVDGPLVVDTGSGAVVAALGRRARATIDTGSGAVALTLPRGLGFDVDLEGSPVEIDGALGFRGQRERGEARGRLGEGGPAIEVETGSGAVRLRAE